MLSAALRQPLRQAATRQPFRRYASTTPTNPTADAAQKKAQDAFAQAQAAGEKLWKGAKKALGPVGERVGEMLGCEWLFFDFGV
jgi:F-type H+-transporting ATPase subunit g